MGCVPKKSLKGYIKWVLVPGIFLLTCFQVDAREIVDMAGRRVTVPDTISRVCSTSPPATYMVYTLAPDLLAGLNFPFTRHERTYLRPDVLNLPVVGGWFGQGRAPNLETLLQIRPDIVIAWYRTDSAANQKIEATLKPLGIPLVYTTMNTLGEYPAAFRFLGKLLGREQRAAALADYSENVLENLEKVRSSLNAAGKVRVYYAEGPNGLFTECHRSSHAELIELCGGVNVHQSEQANGYGMQKVSMEQVLGYNPDVIVTADKTFYAAVRSDPRWQTIRAVQNNRIYKIPCSPFNWFDRPPSFMRLIGAQWLVSRLYPNHHTGYLQPEITHFYNLFLGVRLSEKAALDLVAP